MINKKIKHLKHIFLIVLLILCSFSAYASSCDTVFIDTLGASAITTSSVTLQVNAFDTLESFSGLVGVRYRIDGTSSWTPATSQTYVEGVEYYNFSITSLNSGTDYQYQGYVIADGNECVKYDLSPNTFTTDFFITTGFINGQNAFDENFATYSRSAGDYDLTIPFDDGVQVKNINVSNGHIGDSSSSTVKLYVKETPSGSYVFHSDITLSQAQSNQTIVINDFIYGYEYQMEQFLSEFQWYLYESVLEEDLIPPSISLGEIHESFVDGVDMNFIIDSLGGYSTVTAGINYSDDGFITSTDGCSNSFAVAGTKNCLISNLESNTLYDYKVFVEYNGERIQTATSTFLTSSEDAVVYSKLPTDITYNHATLRGEVFSMGSSDELECFFEFGKANETLEEFVSTYVLSEYSMPWQVSVEADDLESSTDYEYDFYCRDSSSLIVFESLHAENRNFTTLDAPAQIPVIENLVVTGITDTNATLNIDLVSDFTIPSKVQFEIYEQGNFSSLVVYETTVNTLEIPYTYSKELTDLKPNTTYSYKAKVLFGASLEHTVLSGSFENFETLSVAEYEEELGKAKPTAKDLTSNIVKNIFIIISFALIIGVQITLGVNKVKHPMVYFIAFFLSAVLCNVLGILPILVSVFIIIGALVISLLVAFVFKGTTGG